MDSLIYFISHPEVIIDKNVPVSQWDLSEKGKRRVKHLLTNSWIQSIKLIYLSNEQKAKTTAHIIRESLKLPIHYREDLREIDRSATGYLEAQEFERVVNQFFANPFQSVRRWEKAVDAQERIVKAIKNIINEMNNQPILIVSHGGVGALLMAYLLREPISRDLDQPGDEGGNYFVFTSLLRLVSKWNPIEKDVLEWPVPPRK